MTIEEKRKIANKMIIRASQSLKFVKDYLSSRLNDIDEPYLRSLYILLSFSFELILKSRVIMLSAISDRNTLNTELQKLGHDFAKISQKLGSNELNNIDIKTISLNRSTGNYIITNIKDKKIDIYNFIDIRYSFMDKNEKMIFVKNSIHKEINNNINVMLKKKKKILNLNKVATTLQIK